MALRFWREAGRFVRGLTNPRFGRNGMSCLRWQNDENRKWDSSMSYEFFTACRGLVEVLNVLCQMGWPIFIVRDGCI